MTTASSKKKTSGTKRLPAKAKPKAIAQEPIKFDGTNPAHRAAFRKRAYPGCELVPTDFAALQDIMRESFDLWELNLDTGELDKLDVLFGEGHEVGVRLAKGFDCEDGGATGYHAKLTDSGEGKARCICFLIPTAWDITAHEGIANAYAYMMHRLEGARKHAERIKENREFFDSLGSSSDAQAD